MLAALPLARAKKWAMTSAGGRREVGMLRAPWRPASRCPLRSVAMQAALRFQPRLQHFAAAAAPLLAYTSQQRPLQCAPKLDAAGPIAAEAPRPHFPVFINVTFGLLALFGSQRYSHCRSVASAGRHGAMEEPCSVRPNKILTGRSCLKGSRHYNRDFPPCNRDIVYTVCA